MKRLLHAVIAWLYGSDGHVLLRDRLLFAITKRSALVRRLRGWWREDHERPGFRAWED